MRPFLVLIGPKGSPRLRFEVYAEDSCACVIQHMDLALVGEKIEVIALEMA